MTKIDRFNNIIDLIENRCMASEGPVMPTLKEATEDELSALWHLLQEIKTELNPETSQSKILTKYQQGIVTEAHNAINKLALVWATYPAHSLHSGFIEKRFTALINILDPQR